MVVGSGVRLKRLMKGVFFFLDEELEEPEDDELEEEPAKKERLGLEWELVEVEKIRDMKLGFVLGVEDPSVRVMTMMFLGVMKRRGLLLS